MKITRKRLDAIRAEAPTFGYRPRPISIHARVRDSARRVRNDIERNHSSVLMLLEEAIRFVIAFEDHQHARDEHQEQTVPCKFLLSRVRADLVAIHQLLLIGQETSALAVARVFIEDLELVMATAIDTDFSREYLEFSSADGFWKKRVGYGKIYPLVERFIARGANDSRDVKSHIQHHQQLKTFLSGHIHPSFSAALRTVPPAGSRSARAVREPPAGMVWNEQRQVVPLHSG